MRSVCPQPETLRDLGLETSGLSTSLGNATPNRLNADDFNARINITAAFNHGLALDWAMRRLRHGSVAR